MAFASIIGSAIGILLLIITAYVLVAGVLTATQVAMNAQSDMTAVHMQMLATDITIESTTVENSSSPNIIYLELENSGSEPIDISTLNVFFQAYGLAPELIPEDSITHPWSIEPNIPQWRPTEKLKMSVKVSDTYQSSYYPVKIQLTTGNGVSRYANVTSPS